MQQTFEWEMVIFNQSCSYVLLQIVVALYHTHNPLLQLASATSHYLPTAVFMIHSLVKVTPIPLNVLAL